MGPASPYEKKKNEYLGKWEEQRGKEREEKEWGSFGVDEKAS